MSHHPVREFLIDWCGVLLLIVLMVLLTGYLTGEIRRDVAADAAGRAAMAEKVKGARAEHGEIEANQRKILDRLERIEAKMGGQGDDRR